MIGHRDAEGMLLFYDIDIKVGTVTRSSRQKDTTCVEIGKKSMCE